MKMLTQYAELFPLLSTPYKRRQLPDDWSIRCRKEHGERVEARKDLNGKKTHEG